MSLLPLISGIHHVTAITSDAQKNLDFYCGVLGLRLVKLTVNFDDPGSYHLYYGDELGRPGTILTFFVWQGTETGRVGAPQVTTVTFAAPRTGLDYWIRRFGEKGISSAGFSRFDEQVLAFADPDGLQLEILFSAGDEGQPWAGGSVPAEYAIRGLAGVTIAEKLCEDTAGFLERAMKFKAEGIEKNRFRYRIGADDGLASRVDLLCLPGALDYNQGAGVVHHLAFGIADDRQQEMWRNEILAQGFAPSPVKDRSYFHSIYLREPGGVLFEIATEAPGFTVDQPAEQLGSRLMLPPWLESRRREIESGLPTLKLFSG